MLKCWHENPKERPSFSDLKETFEGLLSESEGYIDFDEIREDNLFYQVPSFNSQDDDFNEQHPDDEESGNNNKDSEH